MNKLFLSDRIVLEDREVRGGILVKGGKIEDVLDERACDEIRRREHVEVVATKAGTVLMAGVVDSHVHVNEPGRTAWEGFRTATAAAAAAGATTIVDMPLNSIPPTTTLDNLKVKAAAAENNVFVDVGFWGGVIPHNENELRAMIEAGVVGFKCFLCPSGVDEFPHVAPADLDKAFTALQDTGSVLAFHAELESEQGGTKQYQESSDGQEYTTYLDTRPPDMEVNALKLIQRFANKYKNVRIHIVHVSASECVPLVEQMRWIRSGAAAVTAETCHHYLTLRADLVPRGATQFKCAPPVRDAHNQEKLWEYLREDKLDLVVSDHSPCTPELKCCDFLSSWGGISSVQFGLSLFWTGARKRGFTLHHATKFLSSAPAKLCGLDKVKGSLKKYMDADFIVFDPDETFEVKEEDVKYKNKVSPYFGMELTGKVKKTFLRGELIYDDENDVFAVPKGNLLLNV